MTSTEHSSAIADANTLVLQFIANFNIDDSVTQSSIDHLVEMLSQRKISLLDIALSLREKFLSDEAQDRQRALSCLSSILSKIPKDQMSKNDTSVVFNFYVSKYQDEALMKEVFEGFCYLMGMQNISASQATQVLTSLRENYEPSRYVSRIRYLAFEILKSIHLRWVSSLAEDVEYSNLFTEVYLKIATGERDPKNLLVSFQINKLITDSLVTAPAHIEKLFDVVFSYFPITFTPPKDDPYGITNEDLKLALREALSSTDMFAEDAFTNLLDKLTASSPSVKLETLITLKHCILQFSPTSSQAHWKMIWGSLKFEIMKGETTQVTNQSLEPRRDNEVSSSHLNGDDISVAYSKKTLSPYSLSLDVMEAIATRLIEINPFVFDRFTHEIVDDLKQNFTYSRNLKQTCQLLAIISSVNLTTFNTVIDACLPLFLQYTQEVDKVRLILLNLSYFVEAYIKIIHKTEVNGNPVDQFVKNNHLKNHKDMILMLLEMVLTGFSKDEVTVRTLAIIQYTNLVRMKGFLTGEELKMLVQRFTDTLVTDDNKYIFRASLDGLDAVSELNETLVLQGCVNPLLKLLPEGYGEEIVYQGNDKEPVKFDYLVKVLVSVSALTNLLRSECIDGLLTRLLAIHNLHDGNLVREETREYCFTLLSSIYSLMKNCISNSTVSEHTAIRNSLNPILLKMILDEKQTNVLLHDDYNLFLLSDILYLSDVRCNREAHQKWLQQYNKLFLEEKKILESPNRLVAPYVRLLAALDKEMKFDDAEEVLRKTIALLQKQDKTDGGEIERNIELGYLELIMCLSNKWLDDSAVETLVMTNVVRQQTLPSRTDLKIMVWLGKGLSMKTSSVAGKCILHPLLGYLADRKIGSFTARLFEIFPLDLSFMERFKDVSWNNNVRLLYKQKFFSDIFPKLVSSYQETGVPVEIKSNYLLALSLILKHVPGKLVEPFMKNLLPMLSQALDVTNSEIIVSALSTLKDSVDKFGPLFAEQLETLVPALLRLALPEQASNTAAVRLLSLELLQALTVVLPLEHCLPFKDAVIDGLLPALSDTRRAIRKQAVDTREAYFELGQVPFE